MPAFIQGGVVHAYVDTGRTDDAPVVVFLHGLLASSAVWASQIRALSGTHRTLALDWPGHGASGPAAGPTTLDDLMDTVVALLDGLDVARADLVGLSVGGIVALGAAARFPARVNSLVLVSTPHAPETAAQRARHLETLDTAARIGKEPVLKGIALRMFGVASRRTRADLVAKWLESASHLDLASLRRLSEAALGRPEAPVLGATAPRSLIVHGGDDALLPRSEAANLSTALGGAPVVTIPESGHLVPLENPERFEKELSAFLAGERR